MVSIAQRRREALAIAVRALGDDARDLQAAIDELVVAWRDDEPVAGNETAQRKIELLRKARNDAIAYGGRCNAAAQDVVGALGQDHPASRELIEAFKSPANPPGVH